VNVTPDPVRDGMVVVEQKLFVGSIEIYESEFANHFFAEPEHPSARAIRVHEMRKVQPGFENRGFFKATRRWFHDRLRRLYAGVR
jgi:hypothetical protein